MKLINFTTYIIILLQLCLLTSCGNNKIIQPKESYSIDNNVIIQYSTPTLKPYLFPTSKPNLATVIGKLIALDISMLPGPDDSIFLVPINLTDEISSIPSFQIGEVPQAVVDERTGDFVFINIETGKYALVVMTQSGAQIPATFKEKSSYAIFDIKDNNLGGIYDLNEVTFP